VSEAAQMNPLISNLHVTYETGLSENAVWHALNEDHLYSFHLQFVQTLLQVGANIFGSSSVDGLCTTL
jgi:hypothetical protein